MTAAPRTRLLRGEVDDSRWVMAQRVPSAPLVPFVRRIAGYEEAAPGPRSQRQFPEPFVVLILEFGPPLRVTMGGDEAGAVRHTGGFVAGLGEKYAITEHRGVQRGVQVDLTPTGARRLLGLPLSELDGEVVALRDLLGGDARRLSEQLDDEPDWGRRLDLVEALLLRRIQGDASARLDTRKVDWALGRIEARAGNLPIGSLARDLGHSRRHLNALFHDQVGVSPKLWARLVRFSGVIRCARGAPQLPWAELALEHGYYDQAHLVREVRHFTGLTPTAARESYAELAELLE